MKARLTYALVVFLGLGLLLFAYQNCAQVKGLQAQVSLASLGGGTPGSTLMVQNVSISEGNVTPNHLDCYIMPGKGRCDGSFSVNGEVRGLANGGPVRFRIGDRTVNCILPDPTTGSVNGSFDFVLPDPADDSVSIVGFDEREIIVSRGTDCNQSGTTMGKIYVNGSCGGQSAPVDGVCPYGDYRADFQHLVVTPNADGSCKLSGYVSGLRPNFSALEIIEGTGRYMGPFSVPQSPMSDVQPIQLAVNVNFTNYVRVYAYLFIPGALFSIYEDIGASERISCGDGGETARAQLARIEAVYNNTLQRCSVSGAVSFQNLRAGHRVCVFGEEVLLGSAEVGASGAGGFNFRSGSNQPVGTIAPGSNYVYVQASSTGDCSDDLTNANYLTTYPVTCSATPPPPPPFVSVSEDSVERATTGNACYLRARVEWQNISGQEYLCLTNSTDQVILKESNPNAAAGELSSGNRLIGQTLESRISIAANPGSLVTVRRGTESLCQNGEILYQGRFTCPAPAPLPPAKINLDNISANPCTLRTVAGHQECKVSISYAGINLTSGSPRSFQIWQQHQGPGGDLIGAGLVACSLIGGPLSGTVDALLRDRMSSSVIAKLYTSDNCAPNTAIGETTTFEVNAVNGPPGVTLLAFNPSAVAAGAGQCRFNASVSVSNQARDPGMYVQIRLGESVNSYFQVAANGDNTTFNLPSGNQDLIEHGQTRTATLHVASSPTGESLRQLGQESDGVVTCNNPPPVPAATISSFTAAATYNESTTRCTVSGQLAANFSTSGRSIKVFGKTRGEIYACVNAASASYNSAVPANGPGSFRVQESPHAIQAKVYSQPNCDGSAIETSVQELNVTCEAPVVEPAQPIRVEISNLELIAPQVGGHCQVKGSATGYNITTATQVTLEVSGQACASLGDHSQAFGNCNVPAGEQIVDVKANGVSVLVGGARTINCQSIAPANPVTVQWGSLSQDPNDSPDVGCRIPIGQRACRANISWNSVGLAEGDALVIGVDAEGVFSCQGSGTRSQETGQWISQQEAVFYPKEVRAGGCSGAATALSRTPELRVRGECVSGAEFGSGGVCRAAH